MEIEWERSARHISRGCTYVSARSAVKLDKTSSFWRYRLGNRGLIPLRSNVSFVSFSDSAVSIATLLSHGGSEKDISQDAARLSFCQLVC